MANAPTDADRFVASTGLLRIPVDSVPDLLERMKSRIEKDFPPEARVLLIRWASADGEAAVNWAWKSFRSGYRWRNVFDEIGATWATHDPEGFKKWAVDAARWSSDPWSSSIPLNEAESSELPLLDYDRMRNIRQWLVTESPYLALKFILETGAKTYSQDLLQAMESVQDVREALAACDEFPGNGGPTDGRGGANMREALLLRWFELDPGDFSRSPHADELMIKPWQVTQMIRDSWDTWPDAGRVMRVNQMLVMVAPASRGELISFVATQWAMSDPAATVGWLDSLPPGDSDAAVTARVSSLAARDLTGTLDWADRLPPEQRRGSLTSAFDAWTLAHPGQRADRGGWSTERTNAWADLEALLPAKRN